MAKNTTEAEVIVTLNGQTARNELKRLEAEIKSYEKAAADAYEAGNKALGDKMTKQAKELSKDLSISKKEMKDFSNVIKTLNTKSINELKSAAKQLQSQISKLTPGTQQFIEKSKQLQQVNTRLNSLKATLKEVNMEQKASALSIKSLADGFNKYFGMATAGIAAITGLSMAFRKCAEEAAKLDDVYSDVMKTTGLLHEQVEELDQELMRIDTRTSREQLLLLARDAGKLGIQGKDAILGFVRAADQIQVALGEDLGEGAIRNLGKIADVLGYTASMGIEKSLLSIASSINAVGQASTASEAYLVDFTQRLAGVAAQTNISAANIIGFASGLDQSAMKVEMAATAFQKFVMKLYEDPAKFAEYANMQVKEFTDLLNTDANKAIITVLKSLKDKDGFASLVPIFKDLGLDGARAVSVLAAMATNITAVTEAQALANQEFEKATSVTEEYNTKNNNMQAQLEKARKEFQNASIALGQSLNPIMLKSTKLTTHLIKALASYGKEIKTVVITMAALTTAIKLQTIAQKGLNAANKLGQTIQKTGQTIAWAYRVVMMKLTGQTQLATFAQAELNKVMSASVFGLVATAVSALVFGISRLVKNYRKAAEAADWEATIEKKVNKEYAEQAGRVKALTAIVENNNIALFERKKALEELRNLVPDYHGDLTKEGILINSNKEAIDEYCKSLRQMIRLQTHKDELQELEQQIIEKEDELEKARQKQRDALIKAGGDTTESYSTLGGLKFTDYGKASGKVRVLEKELESLYVRENQISVKMGELTKGSVEGLTEEQREIEEVRKKYEQLFNEAKNAYVGAPAEGMKAMGKLQEQMNKEIELVRKKYASPTITTDGGGGGGSGLDDKAAKKAYEAKTQQLKLQLSMQERDLKTSLARREISEAEYNAKIYAATMENLRLRMEAAQMYGQDTMAIQEEFLDMQLKAIERQQKEEAEMLDAFANVRRAKAKKEAEEEAQRIAGKASLMATEQEILERNLQEVRERLGRENWKEEMDFELWKMQQLHEQGLLSERDYQEARLKVKMEYAQKGAEKLNAIAEEASNFITAIREAESAQLEAQMQKDLTAAGNNAEKREQIEAEYEEKKLALQKKYADVEMAINIAKTIANGAAAAIRAYLDGGAYAGPILAALVAATTAAEVATIVAQRNAIKATSVNSTSTVGVSSSSPNIETGTRTMTGYSEGGFTDSASSDAKPVGIVHANEWVAPAPLVRKNPVLFRNLENYRLASGFGRHGSMGRGFADGGYTSPATESAAISAMTVNEIDWQAMREFNALLRYCSIHGLFVKFGDILIAKGKYESFKKETSR